MAGDINRIVLTGRLTKDPDLRSLPNSDTSVCSLRIAVNGRRRNAEGNWEDQPNFFDVTVWGAQGQNCHRFLKKGRQIAVDGRLRHRQWTTDGQNRSAVDIIAESVQFLGGGRDDAPGGGNGNGFSSNLQAAESDVPIDNGDFEAAPVAAGGDEDIPF